MSLVAACVSRGSPPRDTAAERFETQWQGAADFEASALSLDTLVAPGVAAGLDRPSTVLLTAAFWPDHAADFPGLPGPASGQPQRKRLMPDRLSLRMEVNRGRATHPMLVAENCRWAVYSGLHEEWAPVADGAMLDIGGVPEAYELRVVFGVADQPRSLQGTRHGMAIEITAWGLGLEVRCAQLLDEHGTPLRHWFHGD